MFIQAKVEPLLQPAQRFIRFGPPLDSEILQFSRLSDSRGFCFRPSCRFSFSDSASEVQPQRFRLRLSLKTRTGSPTQPVHRFSLCFNSLWEAAILKTARVGHVCGVSPHAVTKKTKKTKEKPHKQTGDIFTTHACHHTTDFSQQQLSVVKRFLEGILCGLSLC
uniref:Uncharacterized protein n=1 Tax=Anguilla anguilla TaxID=7936 RepID=A0A0E9WYM4_ANGAN